jgi:hypothetical protein
LQSRLLAINRRIYRLGTMRTREQYSVPKISRRTASINAVEFNTWQFVDFARNILIFKALTELFIRTLEIRCKFYRFVVINGNVFL